MHDVNDEIIKSFSWCMMNNKKQDEGLEGFLNLRQNIIMLLLQKIFSSIVATINFDL